MKKRSFVKRIVSLVMSVMMLGASLSALAADEQNAARARNGYYWTKTNLKYYISSEIYNSEERSLTFASFASWQEISYGNSTINFSFTYTSNPDNADIIFQKEAMAEGTLARTDIISTTGGTSGPIEKAYICLNSADRIAPIPMAYVPNDAYDYMSIMQHEIGHAMGIAHCCEEENCANVMGGVLKMGQMRRSLKDYDKASMIALYTIYHPIA